MHGLNSNKSGIKGKWLEAYCAEHYPEIKVVSPNLNLPPFEVMETMTKLIANDPHTGLVGTSLGGFYATACVAKTWVKAVLLNPSVRPFDTLKRRYFDTNNPPANKDDVFFTSAGGWGITQQHIDDLKTLYRPVPLHPERMMAVLKEGDKVLNYRVALEHYSQHGAQSNLFVERDGDHLMHDLIDKIPLILTFLFDVSPHPNAE